MKKFGLIVAAALAALASCSPQAYVLDLEMRYPSLSGDDFTGREMAVAYLDSRNRSDSARVFPKAEAIASALEADYFGSRQAIPIYSIERDPAADYSCADSLIALVMDTGKDVVFLVDGDTVHYYDAMGSGTVKNVSLSSSVRMLKSVWKAESYTLLYYEESAWESALMDASSHKWQEASDKWLKLAGNATNNMQKRSCAEYNIAVACYMVGNNELALEWLDASDRDYPVSLSRGLRSRIKKKAGQ